MVQPLDLFLALLGVSRTHRGRRSPAAAPRSKGRSAFWCVFALRNPTGVTHNACGKERLHWRLPAQPCRWVQAGRGWRSSSAWLSVATKPTSGLRQRKCTAVVATKITFTQEDGDLADTFPFSHRVPWRGDAFEPGASRDRAVPSCAGERAEPR